MTNEKLNTLLYEKLFDEQQNWRQWLLSQTPEEILSHAYEYTIREDIVLALEYTDLSDDQCRALLSSPCPLSDIFTEFERTETDHMDNVRQCMENRANHVIHENKNKEAR